MTENVSVSNYLRGILGGSVGGVLGYVAFVLLARQGLYAMVLPGALLGIGCGKLSGVHSNVLGASCGVFAVLLGLLSEWRTAPFLVDESFAFFMAHVHQLRMMTIVMIAVGGYCGYWFGQGRASERPADEALGEVA